jgi:hypothetical protein
VPGGYNWATLFLGDINTRTWPYRLWGVSNLRQLNVDMSLTGLGHENDCAGEVQQQF